MKNFEFRETKETIEIHIDYKVKDLFKKSFKTAKWNAQDKVWILKNTTRTFNKLEKWFNEMEDVFNSLDEIDEIEFSEKEFEEAQKEIQTLREEIEAIKAAKLNLEEINKDIENSKSEIEALKVELAQAQSEKDNEAESVESFVDSLIDTNQLESISETISDYARKSFLRATEKDDLRLELKYAHKAVEILEKAGFKSRNVSRLSNTTLSRLDRDNYNFSSEDFYDIEKIEE